MSAPPTAAFEEILAYLLAQLAQPVDQETDDDGAVVIVSGDPPEVIVRLNGSHVTVAEYAVAWPSSVVEPIGIGSVTWSAISSDAATRVVRALITAAREARIAKFRLCTHCEALTPPEWMFSDEVCLNCARREGGPNHKGRPQGPPLRSDGGPNHEGRAQGPPVRSDEARTTKGAAGGRPYRDET